MRMCSVWILHAAGLRYALRSYLFLLPHVVATAALTVIADGDKVIAFYGTRVPPLNMCIGTKHAFAATRCCIPVQLHPDVCVQWWRDAPARYCKGCSVPTWSAASPRQRGPGSTSRSAPPPSGCWPAGRSKERLLVGYPSSPLLRAPQGR